MKIDFKKITRETKPFELKRENISFCGTFQKDSLGLVQIDGTLSGELQVVCDRCGKEFLTPISDEVHIKVSDGSYKGEEREYDVIESYDGFVDFDYIFESEVESLKSGYYYCDECAGKNEIEQEL